MSNLPALYQLTGDYKRLEDLAGTDELPADVIRDTLESLEGDIREKSTNVAAFARNLESVAESVEQAAKEMMERARRIRARSDALRNYLLTNMILAGITRIESPYFTLAVRDNPAAVQIDDATSVPERFMVQPDPPPKRPDKVAIKKALQAGEEVEGCRLVKGPRLEVKI